jgi:hypothetical protein
MSEKKIDVGSIIGELCSNAIKQLNSIDMNGDGSQKKMSKKKRQKEQKKILNDMLLFLLDLRIGRSFN